MNQELPASPIYYVSQIAGLTVPHGYDHSGITSDKEILFYINCIDGLKIIYADPNCIYPSYEHEE